MGADGVVLFYGVRYQVADESEVTQLSHRQHPLTQAAERAGLEHYWGNFSLEGDEYYLLYIGKEIAIIGYEGINELELADEQFATIQQETKEKLKRGGFSLVPSLFAQFEPDV
jgi:hypothetical protein